MAKLLQRVELSLRSFYIFNSNFGTAEGEEHKKILYYYPNDIELDTKIKDVGLSIAIITFTGNFTSEDDCKALHTQKTTQIFYQPEPGYWMVLVINVPKEIRSKDGEEMAEYRGGEVHDRVYRAVIEQCYNMFRLFEGTFQMNYNITTDNGNDAAREQLSKTLTTFFNKYLLSLKLSGFDFIDVVRSLQYLPLNKCLFLRANNFVSMIQATFPVIKEIIFLYNDQVVCSGKMNPIDLYSLHEYIVNTLIPEVTHTESGNLTLQRSDSTASEIYRNGAFITGPTTVDGEASPVKPPKVYLRNEDTGLLESYYLIVYRALNAKLCLFIDVLDEPQSDFYTELHSYIGPQLTSIARDIADVLEKIQNSIKQAQLYAALSTVPTIIDPESSAIPKFLFINEQSLKHLSNISTDKRRPKTIHAVPTNVMNLIADFGNEIEELNSLSSSDAAFEELQVKTTNDFWIVKRRSNWRQYYVIISNSKATLLEITHEAKRIFEQELTDDVFFDE